MHITKLLMAVLPAILMGCMKYQYATIASHTTSNDQGEFFIENDSVRIAYSFDGANCPVSISIQNKQSTPLYVDWKRSAIIINNQAFSYWNDKATVNAIVSGSQIHWTQAVTTTRSTIIGEISRDESTSFIPPKSVKEARLVTIRDNFFSLPKEKKKVHMINGQPVKVFKTEFTNDNSPFKYRSYLTISTDPSFTKPSIFEDEFWVSDVVQTVYSPTSDISNKKKRNTFHTSKSTGFGTFLGATSLLALITLLVIATD